MQHPSTPLPPRLVTGEPHGDDLRDRLVQRIRERHDRVVKLRRRIHATPERSGLERETTTLVAEALREHGYDPLICADGVGVIADLDVGGESGTFIGLRCELDCVEVNDDKQVPYASTHPGLCHACGHDAHTVISLSTAAALAAERPALERAGLRHNFRFIFQPAEEEATGARSMIKQGALGGVEGMLALHVDPFLEAGHIGVRAGPLTSACKLFRVTVRGRSGHTARPFEAIDPIPAATSIVSLLYQLAPRSIDSRYPMALTVASIRGAALNAIADHAVVQGTLRAARLVELEAVQKRMHAVVEGVARATGAEVDIAFDHSCPPTNNDPEMVRRIALAAEAVLEPEHIHWIDVPSLGGEDFAFYQELVPGAMVRLGAALPDPRLRRPLHSSLFDIDERALEFGAVLLGWTAVEIARDYSGQHA